MSPPVFVVDSDGLVAGKVVLDGPEGHHAATVSRLRVGESVVLTDGAGRHAAGTVSSVARERVEVAVGAVVGDPPPSPRFVVVQALPKGDRGELAVEAMTELGVDVVVPWAAARCVTRWREGRGDKALARWRTSARSAGKQSRRTRFPEVTALASTDDVRDRLAAAAAGIVLHEQAPDPLAALEVPAAGDVVVVVGPEGGIMPEELAAFEAAGAGIRRLGGPVLRTSTAGSAALAVLSAASRWR